MLYALPSVACREHVQKLLDAQEEAKTAKKGRWAGDGDAHVRSVQWQIDEPRALVERYAHKPIDAVVEQVRDGNTVRAFLLPSFEYVTVILSGIKVSGLQASSAPVCTTTLCRRQALAAVTVVRRSTARRQSSSSRHASSSAMSRSSSVASPTRTLSARLSIRVSVSCVRQGARSRSAAIRRKSRRRKQSPHYTVQVQAVTSQSSS